MLHVSFEWPLLRKATSQDKIFCRVLAKNGGKQKLSKIFGIKIEMRNKRKYKKIAFHVHDPSLDNRIESFLKEEKGKVNLPTPI